MTIDVIDLERYFEYLVKNPIVGASFGRDNGFPNIESVFSNFHVRLDERDVNICHAVYDTPPYEGYATVFFYDPKRNKYYEVHGSHCSCHGLEDQWNPEEINFKALSGRIEKGGFTGIDLFKDGYEEYVTKSFGRVK